MKLADLADAVKRSVTATQVAMTLGLNPNRAGFCKCPLHGEKTGSMKLYPGNRGWFCFGCHQGGSVIDLVMIYYGLDLKGAIEFLNDEFNLGLPVGYKPSQKQEEEAKRRAAEREEERKRREAIQNARNAAFLRWCDLGRDIAKMEQDKLEYAPKAANEVWDPRFITALSELALKKEEANDMALICFGKEE